jgi:hypothetical protein
MQHLSITDKFRATEEAKGYIDYLLSKEVKAFTRAIDAYAFAAAYAMKNNAAIPPTIKGRSNSLAEVFRLDENVRLALEAGVWVSCKRNNLSEPDSEEEMLNILTKYAEVGIQLLQARWREKTGIGIQNDINKMITL